MFKKIIFLLFLLSCSDDTTTQNIQKEDQTRGIVGPADFAVEVDIPIIQAQDAVIVDAYVDPCEGVRNVDENYCQCHPRCCQQQTWYCPPRGTEVQAKQAILDICGEDYVPCDRNLDDSCPPAEIIFETACTHAFDCPPGIDEDFTIYYDCEIDGNLGRQEVRCDKGRLYYGECVSCIASDEVCDGSDNDCDGNVDEHQLNECGECGALPSDICDGLDNDCDGRADEELVQECLTVCERGVESCIAGEWTGCTARQPVEEACDGFDSDCDGLIDEGLSCSCPPEMIGALIPCMEPPLTCGMGFKTCECEDEECSTTRMTDCLAMCAWLPPEIIPHDAEDPCDRLAGIPTQPEICNNFDEDCDGLVDERVEKICYSGPENTVGIGVCEAGRQICQQGQWYGETTGGNFVLDFCSGETVPSREICDGADNDCDGVTDFGEEIPDTDILFVLDWSGSMEHTINSVRMAMNRFAGHFSAEQSLKWGIITGPRIFPREGQRVVDAVEYLRLDSDIANFADFINAFASAGAFENGSSLEMLKDALYLSVATISTDLPYDLASASWQGNGFSEVDSIPSLPQFRVNWRPNADRVIILFTDEEDQSFLVPRISDEQLVTALGASPDTTLYVFAPAHYQRHWREYVNITSGRMFSLTSNPEQMYDNLMSILDEICLPEQGAMSMPVQDYMPVNYRYKVEYAFDPNEPLMCY